MTSTEPAAPDGWSPEDLAQIKVMTTVMASAIILQATADGLGITAAAAHVGAEWKRRSVEEKGRDEDYADAVEEFAVRIGDSLNRVGGARLRERGIPA